MKTLKAFLDEARDRTLNEASDTQWKIDRRKKFNEHEYKINHAKNNLDSSNPTIAKRAKAAYDAHKKAIDHIIMNMQSPNAKHEAKYNKLRSVAFDHTEALNNAIKNEKSNTAAGKKPKVTPAQSTQWDERQADRYYHHEHGIDHSVGNTSSRNDAVAKHARAALNAHSDAQKHLEKMKGPNDVKNEEKYKQLRKIADDHSNAMHDAISDTYS